MLHPEDLGEVVHFDAPSSPPVELCGRIIVLMSEDVTTCRARNGAGSNHLSKCAEQVNVRNRGSPPFAGVASAKPEEVSILCSVPLDSDASFKEREPRRPGTSDWA